MEQTKYWMWSGRELSRRSHVLAAATAYNDSWEEQAFAEDSAGALGGCTWPPRSYSCTFCGREFKSAQALGGHMNVHRRDRARLKQSPNSHQSPCTQLGMQFPSQICSLVCNPNPNPCPNLVASPLSPSKASAPSTQENCYAQGLVSPSHSSSHAQEHKLCSIFPPDPTLSVTAFGILDLKLEGENLKLVEESCRMKRVNPYSEVSSSDLVRNQDQREVSGGDREEISVKRRRKESFLSLFIKPNMGERRIDASLPFFIKPRSYDRDQLQSDVLGLGPNPIEDLDLELRLGDRPKVK